MVALLKKIGQITLYLLVISLIVLVQASLINNLPGWFKDINLTLIMMVFVLFFYDFRSAIFVALVAGFWADIMSFNFFGFYLAIFFLTLVFSDWILRAWLTNRSLYSFLALIFAATLAYNLVAGLMLYWFSDLQTGFLLFKGHFWATLFIQSLWSELSAILLFGVAASLTKRFKPFFLEKN